MYFWGLGGMHYPPLMLHRYTELKRYQTRLGRSGSRFVDTRSNLHIRSLAYLIYGLQYGYIMVLQGPEAMQGGSCSDGGSEAIRSSLNGRNCGNLIITAGKLFRSDSTIG